LWDSRDGVIEELEVMGEYWVNWSSGGLSTSGDASLDSVGWQNKAEGFCVFPGDVDGSGSSEVSD
jgi:hypothetical protein